MQNDSSNNMGTERVFDKTTSEEDEMNIGKINGNSISE